MTEPVTIVQALSAVMTEVSHVGKGDKNTTPGQNYNFRGIDRVVNALGPAFRKHGVVPLPQLLSVEYGTAQTTNGKTQGTCHVTVRYRFYGPGGDYLDAEVAGEAWDSGDKGTAKAMSVAYRTALLQVFALPTDDPDPDTQTYERAPAEPPRRGPQFDLDAFAATLAGMSTREQMGEAWKDVPAHAREAAGPVFKAAAAKLVEAPVSDPWEDRWVERLDTANKAGDPITLRALAVEAKAKGRTELADDAVAMADGLGQGR